MDLNDLIEIGRAWDRMGWAVQSQLEALAGGEPIEDQNPNAMEIALDWMRTVERIADRTPGFHLSDDVAEVIERIRESLDAHHHVACDDATGAPA